MNTDWLTAAVGFHCGVISCEIERRDMRRNAAEKSATEAESSALVCDNAAGLTSILNLGQFFYL